MIEQRILSLDISTKTGWALMISGPNGIELKEYGTQPKISEPDGKYPVNYVDWANAVFSRLLELINRLMPDILVIEETTSGSKSAYSQKILEFIHFLVANYVKTSSIETIYLMTEVWRRETGCLMNDAEKKKNKEVRQYKKTNNSKIAYDKDEKRIGIVGRKHVNVRRANEVFGQFLKTPLRKKDEDTADSLMLGYCYHLRRMRFV